MSDPQGFIAEHFPNLYNWYQGLQAHWQFAVAGMVSARDQVQPSDWLKIVVGVVASSFISSYATGERTATKVEQYAAANAEFRQEMRQFMRENAADVSSLRDRVTRVETITYSNGHAYQQGLSAKVPK